MNTLTTTINGYKFRAVFGVMPGFFSQEPLINGVVVEWDMSDVAYLAALEIANNYIPGAYAASLIVEDMRAPNGRDETKTEAMQKYVETYLASLPNPWINETDQAYIQEYIDGVHEELERIRQKAISEAALERVRKSRARGFVYLLQSESGYYKIGRTKNPDDRLRTFNVKLPIQVEYLAVIETDDMVRLEKELHKRYADKRINGEWFTLTDDDIDYILSLAEQPS